MSLGDDPAALCRHRRLISDKDTYNITLKTRNSSYNILSWLTLPGVKTLSLNFRCIPTVKGCSVKLSSTSTCPHFLFQKETHHLESKSVNKRHSDKDFRTRLLCVHHKRPCRGVCYYTNNNINMQSAVI